MTSLREHSTVRPRSREMDLSNWDTSRCDEICMEHSTVRPRSREMDCQIGIRRG